MALNLHRRGGALRALEEPLRRRGGWAVMVIAALGAGLAGSLALHRSTRRSPPPRAREAKADSQPTPGYLAESGRFQVLI
jgi:hypothetical protein